MWSLHSIVIAGPPQLASVKIIYGRAKGGAHQNIKEEGRRPKPDAADPEAILASV